MNQYKPIQHILFFSVTVIIFIYICSIGIRNVFRYNTFKRSYDTTVMMFASEQNRFQRLNQQIESMNFLEFWELQGKRRLGFVKKDEVVYIVSSKPQE